MCKNISECCINRGSFKKLKRISLEFDSSSLNFDQECRNSDPWNTKLDVKMILDIGTTQNSYINLKCHVKACKNVEFNEKKQLIKNNLKENSRSYSKKQANKHFFLGIHFNLIKTYQKKQHYSIKCNKFFGGNSNALHITNSNYFWYRIG